MNQDRLRTAKDLSTRGEWVSERQSGFWLLQSYDKDRRKTYIAELGSAQRKRYPDMDLIEAAPVMLDAILAQLRTDKQIPKAVKRRMLLDALAATRQTWQAAEDAKAQKIQEERDRIELEAQAAERSAAQALEVARAEAQNAVKARKKAEVAA